MILVCRFLWLFKIFKIYISFFLFLYTVIYPFKVEVFLDWSFSLILFLNLSFRIYENLFFLFLSFLLFFEKSNSSLRTGLNWKFFFAILSYKFYYIFLMSKSICFIVKYPFSKRYVFFFFIYKIQITNSSTFLFSFDR